MALYCFWKAPFQDYYSKFTYDSYIEELKYKNKVKIENKSLENSCLKYDLDYEYVGLREIRGIKDQFYKLLDPLTLFIVKDDTILEENDCYITIKFKRGFM